MATSQQDFSDRCNREAKFFEQLSDHYAQLAAHAEQQADQWRHAANTWDVALGGKLTADRHRIENGGEYASQGKNRQVL
jgi:hypothetical protein